MGTFWRHKMGIVRMSHPGLDGLFPMPDARCPVHWEGRLLHRTFPLRHAYSAADTR